MEVLTTVDAQRIGDRRAGDGFFWLDLESPGDEELARLGGVLGLHELALEDMREMQQPPKVDRFGDHLLIVWWSAEDSGTGSEYGFEPLEVHLYVSGSYVVTVRRRPSPALARLHAELGAGDHAEADVVYRILDALTDRLRPIGERIEQRIDALEEQVLERPRREQVAAIYRLKQEVRETLRRIEAQGERFGAIARAVEALPGLTLGTAQAQSDLRDHLVQAEHELTRQNEDLTALTATYYNASTERLSSIATRLSVIATLFLVWTLLTSFFGQNFGWMVDNVDTKRDFLLFGVGGFVVSTLVTAAFLWWRRNDLR